MRIIYTPKNIFKRNSRFSPLSKNISRFAVEYIHFELDIFFAYKANYLTEASEYTQKTTLFYSYLKNISRNISNYFVILDIYPIFAT